MLWSMHLLLRKILCLISVSVFLSGCGQQTLPGDYGDFVKFADSVESNAQPDPSQIATVTLAQADGSLVKISDLTGDKNLLLVVSRGLVGSLPNAVGETEDKPNSGGKSFCIFCSTQTSRLVANYAKFQQRNTEVVVVFPVVDPVYGLAPLDAHPVPVTQAAVADRLVLTKADLLDTPQPR